MKRISRSEEPSNPQTLKHLNLVTAKRENRRRTWMTASLVYLPGSLALTFVGLTTIAPQTAMCLVDASCPTPYDMILGTGIQACNCPPMSPPDPEIFGTTWFTSWSTTGNVVTIQGLQCCQMGGSGSHYYSLHLSDINPPENTCYLGTVKLKATGPAWPSPNPDCPNNVSGSYTTLEWQTTVEGSCP